MVEMVIMLQSWLPEMRETQVRTLKLHNGDLFKISLEFVNWCPLESHPDNSDHPVRFYCRCQCLSSSHMVIVHLLLQLPLCGINCQQILEMHRFLKIFNLF